MGARGVSSEGQGKHPGRCILSLVAGLRRRVMGLHSLPVGEQMLDRPFTGQKMDGTWWQIEEKK